MIDIPTPYNQYAEEFILASTFLDDRVVGDLIASGVSEDTFHESIHQDVWRIVKQFYAEGMVFDEVGVAQELKEKYDYAEPMAVVNQISKAAETTTSTPIYIKICNDTERRRKLLRAAITCVDSVCKEMEPTDIQEKLSQALQDSGQDILSDADISTESGKVINDIRERNSKQVKFIGISTGFRLLDYYLGGYRPESLNILAGRPGAGKTSFALQLALNILHQQIPVRIWSLEMSAEQLLAKLIANLSEVDPNRSKDGLITEAEFDLMEQARYRLTKLPLFISDASHVTVDRIAAQHRRDLVKHGQCMLFIDYLQLIRSSDRKLSREQQISTMSRDLKCLFKDTKTQGIVLSQLNRNSDQSAEPKLSDLRESGAIEQDADTVMFIFGEGQVKIGKNRHGAEGKLTMNFNKPISKFTTN
jgi:replicative DNA helicase